MSACSGWNCGLPGNVNRSRRTSTAPTRTIECLVSWCPGPVSFGDATQNRYRTDAASHTLSPAVAYCAEIYDMAGLGFGQFHRRGLRMLSASIGLGTTCVYHCSPTVLSWFDDAHVSVCSCPAAQANYPEDLCQTYSAPCHT